MKYTPEDEHPVTWEQIGTSILIILAIIGIFSIVSWLLRPNENESFFRWSADYHDQCNGSFNYYLCHSIDQ
jgi:hypothetical protein